MSVKLKALQAVAGTTAANAGGATNVEDVFSTYLYDGNGSTQTITNGIALGDFGVGTSTEFDGVSDYLTKTFSAGTFGSGSKTFTFSAWFWWDGTTSETIFQFATFLISANQPAGNILTVSGYSNTYATIFGAQTSAALNKNSWNHLLVSIDLSNTANRHVYINDASASSIYPTYSNTAIGFDVSGVATVSSSSAPWTGKLAHVYLDYTYRDLSNSANRRLFIDANGGSTSPSTLSALSPVVYFPMTDAYAIGENLGTGGDFTVNGSPTIVQSGTEYISGVGEGGLVWIKKRTGAAGHQLFDTERGVGQRLWTDTLNAQDLSTNTLTSFNSTGFSIGGADIVNDAVGDLASWTFRKAPKFFDVVTYTGDGVAGRQISHNLGSKPGFIIVKRTDTGNDPYNYWRTAHIEGSTLTAMDLNTTSDASTTPWNLWSDASTATSAYAAAQQTDAHFTVGSNASINGSGGSFVAYLFAHNDGDGEFGPDGDADIIKCGSYTGNESSPPEIDLGFEPQWVMIKRTGVESWAIFDNMRGVVTGGNDAMLRANEPAVEYNAANQIEFTSTGFKLTTAGLNVTNTTGTYIYIAIRRGTKVPESADEVFEAATRTAGLPSFEAPFAVDMGLVRKATTSLGGVYNASRLTGTKFLYTNGTDAEANDNGFVWDFMDGWANDGGTSSTVISWMWKRAPKFFDAVAYTGDGVAGRTVSHNLGVAPEMMWVKRRNTSRVWSIYHHALGNEGILRFDNSDAGTGNLTWNSTDPSADEFTLGSQNTVNAASDTFIAYLFASLPGISKVGSYTGNGSSQTIDCGFTSGARFVLVKRSSNLTGDWFVWDTTRGIGAGNDPYISLNDTYAEVTNTDRIDPHSSGFIVTDESPTAINASGVTYIFYAIA